MRHTALLVLLVIAASALRVGRLDVPSRMVFDEIYYAKAARQYLHGQEVTEEITHPPLSKLIIALGIRSAGDRPLGWRLAGALAGGLLVLLCALLIAEVLRVPFATLAGALLLAVDGLAFVESRIAKPDIFLALFLVTSYWAFWRYLRRGRPGWAYLSGLAAGMAVATKWTGLAPLAAIPIYLVILLGQDRWTVPRRRHWLHLVVAYTVVPAAVYLAAWTPYLLGHSPRDLVQFHVFMFRFHAGLTATHPYQSQWWSWPLLLRPIWYEFVEAPPGVYRGVVAIGNPALWWFSLGALVFVAWHAVRTRDPGAVFIVVGFLGSYLPYAFIGRALFLYHMLPALPFMVMATAAVLARLRVTLGPAVPLLYLGVAVAWFAAYYPVLAALPLAPGRFYRLMWLGTWL
ncbi:MAG: phospholipid carrier-dependent glycosyltransferase [Armatimonadota bacterium]|nr:phospholipid carrier-dependent glycosyltransferase [Armatimonadota bacterium]MDR7428137.1 phospholipid carrier-dependent glycosyltransferase [Armatimonadota bacterium]MDR7463715.1 phospholipid carrier-dependent glycosyltransferase [Armatimonadota bacterium]MDR7470192.1 phospholipid carrier-dependent glycosyltransferase [Armatimonadota bacterium]MDR7473620.1 phospholipid carrier-dependent glycosyltransferase [Armatimonadota bacterium]